jgi:acyl-CoA synthetase (AMP-forming)/AMP-acid ligase II
MGLFMGVMHPLYCGSQNLLASARYFMARPRRWFEHLSRQRVLLNFTTNSAMAFCLRQLERMNAEKLDLTRLHLYFGAEKVSPIVLRQTLDIVRRFSMPPEHIHVGYGMAENTLGAAGTLGGAPRIVHAAIAHDNSVEIRPEPSADTVELVSCGGSYLGVTITIRDDEDRTVGDLHLGEISVQSPCVTPGYINNPEATERALPEPGRLLTRDLGFLYDGELFFHARKDDLLIVGGRNIVPDDIEMTVEQLEFIRQGTTALVGIENSRSGTLELTLLIESKPELGPEEFKRRRTQARDVIYDTYGLLLNHIIFCEKNTIEKTSSGKKRRKVIRDRFVKDELTLY